MVIATVFLTILGGTGGFLLSRYQSGNRQVGSGALPSETVTEPTKPPFEPPGPFCPEQTRATARKVGINSDLWQVLKIYTDNDSTYWICTDVNGLFYYQSKTGGIDAPLIEGKNGLFLQNVSRTGDDAYEVVDQKGNRFVITSDEFELHFEASGKVQRNSARTAG